MWGLKLVLQHMAAQASSGGALAFLCSETTVPIANDEAKDSHDKANVIQRARTLIDQQLVYHLDIFALGTAHVHSLYSYRTSTIKAPLHSLAYKLHARSGKWKHELLATICHVFHDHNSIYSIGLYDDLLETMLAKGWFAIVQGTPRARGAHYLF